MFTILTLTFTTLSSQSKYYILDTELFFGMLQIQCKYFVRSPKKIRVCVNFIETKPPPPQKKVPSIKVPKQRGEGSKRWTGWPNIYYCWRSTPVKWVKMHMGDLRKRAQPIRRQWWTYGRIEDKSPTNKKTGMKMKDLNTRARPIRRKGWTIVRVRW